MFINVTGKTVPTKGRSPVKEYLCVTSTHSTLLRVHSVVLLVVRSSGARTI